ncbi:MAG: TIGR00341 family protein [Candidatus Ventricola sp.]
MDFDRVSCVSVAAAYESGYNGKARQDFAGQEILRKKADPVLKKWIKCIFGEAFSLSGDTASQEEIYDRLVNGAAIKGTNMCVLIFAILIASIGLNMNSTAVIIGAMLISPLMGSIIAIAYGIASGDLSIARHYFVGFLLQIAICLLTSTLYFSITPISNSTSELLARTTPTIWDVLIAICGGLAGCIGLTRKEKSNVIPGVAIATALMPPLCTAGYGLATGQYRYFAGAFYLFTLNSYFICLSSVAVLAAIKVPRRHNSQMGEQLRKKAMRRVAISTTVLLIPSLFFAARLIHENDITGFEEQAVTQMQELGDEATILFPQIDSLSASAGYGYQDGEVGYAQRLLVTLDEPISAEREETMRTWLQKRTPMIDEIEIVLSP